MFTSRKPVFIEASPAQINVQKTKTTTTNPTKTQNNHDFLKNTKKAGITNKSRNKTKKQEFPENPGIRVTGQRPGQQPGPAAGQCLLTGMW